MIQIVQRKLDAGPVLVALGAIVLFVSLWVDWFTPGGNGWETFETLDLVLAAIALTAPLIAFGRLAAGDGRLVTTLAVAAVVVILAQLIQPPPIAHDADIGPGAWLGLIGALAMVVGATLSLASISVSVDVRGPAARRPPPAGSEDPERTQTMPARERDDREPGAP